MAESKKNEWRDIALMAAQIPTILPNPVSYECFVGLWLNRAELLYQQAYAIFFGTSFAGSLDDVPAEIFLSVCDDEASAFELMVKTNNARSMVKIRSQNPTQRTHRLL